MLFEIEAAYQKLLGRRRYVIECGPKGMFGKVLASRNLELLQQVQLHRAERLLAAADPLLLTHNVYALALVARGLYESVAIVGYLCNRLESFAHGNIDADAFALLTHTTLLGTRYERFSKNSNTRDSLSILTCMDKADSYLKKHSMIEKDRAIRPGYDWLSEFAHPNIMSNFSAFEVDNENRRFILLHEEELDNFEFGMMDELNVSSSYFVDLLDELSKRAVDGCLDQ